jgi:hypothetical protein
MAHHVVVETNNGKLRGVAGDGVNVSRASLTPALQMAC